MKLSPWIMWNPLRWWRCCRFGLSELDKPTHKKPRYNISKAVESFVDKKGKRIKGQ
jgi:hypothetical protein